MTFPMPSDPADRDQYWREVVMPRVAAALADREAALAGGEELVSRVEALLFDDDPIGISFGKNADEYRPEAQTIVIRLPETVSQNDVQRIVHEEFISWFSRELAGAFERYRSVAEAIWDLWTASPNGSGRTPG
jgi:hypothetical protein